MAEEQQELSQEEQNKLFKDIADAHIKLANDHMEEADLHLASTGLLYGASRFSAFTVANICKNKQEYEDSLESAVEHYTQVFKNMLEENLDNYRAVFVPPPKEDEGENKLRYEHLMKDQD